MSSHSDDRLTCVAQKRAFLSSLNARKIGILFKSHCTIGLGDTGTEIRCRGKREKIFIFHLSLCAAVMPSQKMAFFF